MVPGGHCKNGSLKVIFREISLTALAPGVGHDGETSVRKQQGECLDGQGQIFIRAWIPVPELNLL